MAYAKQMSASGMVKPTGAAKLIGVLVSSTSSGTLAFYNSLQGSASDTKIIDTITPAAGTNLFFGSQGIEFDKGLYVATTNTISFTVIYE